MKFENSLFLLFSFGIFSSEMHAQTCGNDTLSLEQKWEYGTGLSLPLHVTVDALNSDYIFVAAKNGGLIILDVSQPNQGTLVNTIPVSSFDNLEVMNCEQYSNYLYLSLGNYFGTNIQKAGMAIVDVTDPLNPVITDQWENSTIVKGAAILKVEGDYAYLGAMTDGLIILNVADKNNIQFVSKFIPDINWPVENPIPSATPNARGMEVIDDIVYLCYDAGGLRIINVSDKLNPKETGRYINQSALSKQQAYNNVAVHDHLAYFGVDYCGMEIVDVSDTTNLTQVGWWNPWDCTSPFNIWIGSHGHGNEVTYDDQQKVVFMSCGASDLRVIDVSDPENPDSCSGFGSYSDSLGAYSATVFGDKIFLSYITSLIPFFSVWSGVKEVEWSSTFNSVSEVDEQSGFSITPNPFNDEIQVQFQSRYSGKATVEISDMFGRIYGRQDDISIIAGSNSWRMKLPQLPVGMYFISFDLDGGAITRKLLKQE